MIKRNPKHQRFLDTLSQQLGLIPQAEAEEKKLCVRCKKTVTEFRDEISKREHNITGFCQACQDWLYADLGDEDE